MLTHNGISALKSSIVDCLHLTLATVVQPIFPHHSQEHICEKDPFNNQVGFILKFNYQLAVFIITHMLLQLLKCSVCAGLCHSL